MLSAYNELIGVAWMLVIMYDIRNKHCIQVQLLQLGLEIANGHNEMHGLQRIDDVVLIMIGIFFKISLRHLSAEIEACFRADMKGLIKFIDWEDLVVDEGETVVLHILQVVEAIELNAVEIFKCILKMFTAKVLQLCHLEEL